MFNAYRRYKVIKVEDGDSVINWNKTNKPGWVPAAINWTKIYEKYLNKSYILVSALFQKRNKGSQSRMLGSAGCL